MVNPVAVVDLFSGPGGLAEGFAPYYDPPSQRRYEIALSVENDPSAYRTLRLRAFLRKFPKGQPPEYYDYLNGETSESELDWAMRYPSEWNAAKDETIRLEIGRPTTRLPLEKKLAKLHTKHEGLTVLIGGPPCQVHSIARARRVAVQNQIRNEIHQFLEQLRSSIRIYGSTNPDTALKDPDMAALHDVFNTEYRQDCGMEWRDLQQYLWESVSAIVVKEVNNRSPGSLDYSEHSRKGLNVIAVGGYSLSRGLTLRGLVISYFLRNSMMYDTLMQMGRWFGYRPEYEDLCRIWMPERAEGWYGHIAESVEELRDELRSMESVGATPMQFGLKVRSHPEALMVTARNKMGSSVPVKISIGLSNCFIETAILRRDAQSLLRNLRAAIALASNLRSIGRAPEDGEKVGKGDSSRLVRSVPVRLIVDFLGAFRNHEGSMHTDPGPLRRYIEKQVMGELREWGVLFFGVGGLPSESYRLVDSSLGFTLTCQRRTEGDNSDDRTLMITNKQRVASRGVERYGLTEDCIRDAERRYREEHRKDLRDGKKVNYPDRIFRRVRTKPLLVIHLLEVRKGEKRSVDQPVVAWSMSFPKATHSEERVEWLVNTTWVREQYLEEDEDEASGDDE